MHSNEYFGWSPRKSKYRSQVSRTGHNKKRESLLRTKQGRLSLSHIFVKSILYWRSGILLRRSAGVIEEAFTASLKTPAGRSTRKTGSVSGAHIEGPGQIGRSGYEVSQDPRWWSPCTARSDAAPPRGCCRCPVWPALFCPGPGGWSVLVFDPQGFQLRVVLPGETRFRVALSGKTRFRVALSGDIHFRGVLIMHNLSF